MLKDITLGQYFPGNTLIHRLDPRTKLLCVVLYIVALFCAKWFVSYGLVAAVLITCIRISRVKLKTMTKGLKTVYIIVGQNKVEPDLHKAIDRARNVASPLNTRRLNRKTPCAQGELRCHDCSSPERICRAMVILMNPPGCKAECHVVVVEEDLGY